MFENLSLTLPQNVNYPRTPILDQLGLFPLNTLDYMAKTRKKSILQQGQTYLDNLALATPNTQQALSKKLKQAIAERIPLMEDLRSPYNTQFTNRPSPLIGTTPKLASLYYQNNAMELLR